MPILQRIARLVPPHSDKNWSFQVQHRHPGDADKVRVAMHHAKVQPTSPFLQGCTNDWLMVEFWTNDKEAIDTAANHLAETLNLPYAVGEFTREEVFGKGA